jgi:hypothetical protein
MQRSFEHNQRDPRRASGQQRRFGALLVALLLLAAWFAHAKSMHAAVMLLPVTLALLCTVLAVGRPDLLQRPLSAWLAVGMLLGRIVSPIVLGLLYFLMIAPIAVIGRWCGRDELRLKRDPVAPTYWVEREAPGPTAESFRQQF